tara:strand:+ start:68 stop:565 length:498 start_codon:yes stop_codon:yes gene_type:complete
MRTIILSLIALLSFSFSNAQDDGNNSLDLDIDIGSLITTAKNLLQEYEVENIISDYEIEFGILWIKNETMLASKRQSKTGMIYWDFISSNDGDKRLNNISPRVKKDWNLVQDGEGNEMKLIANKLNEGWQIVDFDVHYQTGNVVGVSVLQQPIGWIVHMQRKVQK